MGEDVRVALTADPSAAAEARSITQDALVRWGLASMVDTACLLVSEVVANVVTHGAWPSELTIARRPGRVHVAVSDGSPDLPRRVHPSAFAVSGRGLALVEDLAASWGCVPVTDHGGKIVWFELPVRAGAGPVRGAAPVAHHGDQRWAERARRQDASARMTTWGWRGAMRSADGGQRRGRARWGLCAAHTALLL